MVWWEILEGKKPFWKADCQGGPGLFDALEGGIRDLLLAPSNRSLEPGQCPAPQPDFIPNPPSPPIPDTRVDQGSIVGPGQFTIFKNEAGTREVLEIAFQPGTDCHIQVFEGQLPASAIRFVQANNLWSWPGRVFTQDVNVTVYDVATTTYECRSRPVYT